MTYLHNYRKVIHLVRHIIHITYTHAAVQFYYVSWIESHDHRCLLLCWMQYYFESFINFSMLGQSGMHSYCPHFMYITLVQYVCSCFSLLPLQYEYIGYGKRKKVFRFAPCACVEKVKQGMKYVCSQYVYTK